MNSIRSTDRIQRFYHFFKTVVILDVYEGEKIGGDQPVGDYRGREGLKCGFDLMCDRLSAEL